MRRNVLTGPAGRAAIISVVMAAALGGAVAAATSAAAGGGHAGARAAAACARVSVTAKPTLNTQAGSTETLRTTITSCAPKFEVVTLKQQLSIRGNVEGTVGLYRHEKVEITQQIPYRCCGSFTVTDRAYSGSGKLLAKAKATWTFA